MISFVCLILRPPALSEVFDREEEMYCISPLFTNFFTNSDLKNSSYTLYTVQQEVSELLLRRLMCADINNPLPPQ